jgi:F0F1-type ATP synthase alpha subunit
LQNGILDHVPIESVAKFREELPPFLDISAKAVVEALERTGKLDDTQSAELKSALRSLAAQMAADLAASPPAVDTETG